MRFLLLLTLIFLLGCEKLNEIFLEEDLLQRPPSQRCADCHTKIYKAWKESRHYHAWISEKFKEETENYSKLKCLSCHAPHQVDPLKKPLLRVERRHEGVNCIACHFKE
ncbi:multiheme c-type cytochrome [Aquifex sp.]